MAILYPQVFSTLISLSAPSVIGMLSAMSFITLASRPFNNATRSLKLSLKSISPRMARAVISLTLSPTPARLASSSMHSVCMSVESMSKHINLLILRYMSSCWNEKSTAISCDMFISSFCMAAVSAGLPLSENSMHALTFRSGCLMLIRPVRRKMESMLRPCSAIIFVVASICRAESERPMRVSM